MIVCILRCRETLSCFATSKRTVVFETLCWDFEVLFVTGPGVFKKFIIDVCFSFLDDGMFIYTEFQRIWIWRECESSFFFHRHRHGARQLGRKFAPKSRFVLDDIEACGLHFGTPPKLDVLKRKFFGSLGAADPKKLNFNFKVLNRRIFTRRIRFFVDHRAVQINNPFFQYLKFTLY